MKRNNEYVVIILLSICIFVQQYFLINEFSRNSKINEIKNIITTKYYKEITEEYLNEKIIENMFKSLNDPYSQYYSKEKMKSLNNIIDDKYIGIGIQTVFNNSGQLEIKKVYSGSVAERNGLQVGDIILSINNEKPDEENIDKIIEDFSTESLNKNVLKVSGSDNEISQIEIMNEVIEKQSVFSDLIKIKEKTLGYIIITNFNKKTADEFKNKFNQLSEKEIDSLIIDLRNNPGGLIESSIQICEQILPEDKVLYTVHFREKTIVETTKSSDSINIPIFILVNKNTASAAEVLSGALKDNNAATIIGEKTFGKGLLQEMVTFNDGTGYTLSVAEYSTPRGTLINNNGIEPNIIANSENILTEIYQYIK